MSERMVFVDKFMEFGVGIGLPRSVARVLGYLIICEPRQQSAVAVQEALQLSTGSVSIAMSMLIDMQLVERVRLPGERKHYYQLRPDGFVASVQRRLETFGIARDIAEYGLQVNAGDERLVAMRGLYGLLDVEMRAVVKKLDQFKTKP